MSQEIYCADATELAAKIRTKVLSPVEVMRAHLERIEAINPKINAVVTLAADALEQAQKAEDALMRGEIRGPLHGVPFTAKDCFDSQGLRTTRGSLIFSDLVPAADATALRRLREGGGILLGKTNLPEFALRAETSNKVFGRTLNPWNLERTAGGSSGGEAAAIAAGLSPLGIGTDLGGSNRLPSHYCGIVGFKPSHGRIPLTGSWPELMCRHMHVGPLARTVRDAALALALLAGPDNRDPYAVPPPMALTEEGDFAIQGLRVGYFQEGPFAPVEREIQQVVGRAAASLQDMGCVVEAVEFDWRERLAIDVCMAMVVAEGEYYLRALVQGREEELSASIQGLLGVPLPPLEDFLASLDKRELLARDMAQFFQHYDLLLCPTAPNTAHGHEAEKLLVDGQEAALGPGHAANITATFGLTGSPAISVPFATSREGLPIGVQLVAPHRDEATLLGAATALEQAGVQGRPEI